MITFVRPDLAVVIVTYNSSHDIGDLLDSIPAALDGLTADVVVVDNGSADGTADLVAARGDCRVVRSANVGYAGGINRGVREAAPADAILVLNPDARLSEHAVPPLLEALREPRTGIVVPQLRSADGALEPSLRREPTLLRARDLGLLTRYEPRSVVVHTGGGSGRNDMTHAMQIVNRVRLYRRRNGVLASWCYFWLAIASEMTWVARGHPQSRFAIAALLRPSLRPAELGCSDRLLPR